MSKLRITYVKSSIGYARDQKETIKALGLRKLNHYVERPDNPSVRGMVEKVKHLVRVEDADAVPAPTKPVTRRPRVIATPDASGTAAPVAAADDATPVADADDAAPVAAADATADDSTSNDAGDTVPVADADDAAPVADADATADDSTSNDASGEDASGETDSKQDTTKGAGNETA